MARNSAAAAHYVRKNFDQAAILVVAAKLAFDPDPKFSESEEATIAAMQRAHPQAGNSPQELGDWLAKMDEQQIEGVVNNTKGVLHEMEFVRLENEDGDTVHAAIFGSTNNPGYDVQFRDTETGEQWQAQLKATDDPGYVREWVEAHPDGEILVTEEVAERLDLSSSGQSNEELTARTEDVVDRLLELDSEDGMWDYFPGLTAASLGIVMWELWQRHRRGEISFDRFKSLAAKTTGLKAGKLALLTFAMMVPGLNVITGAALVASLIVSGASMAKTAAKPRNKTSPGRA